MDWHEAGDSEALARADHARLAAAIAIAELGIWELDLESRVLTASEHCRAHLGAGLDGSLTYDDFVERIHPLDRAMVARTLTAAIAGKSDFAADFRVAGSAGEVRWISLTGRRVAEGRPRLLGATLDVTLRCNATALLERSVAERTQELRNTVAELEAFAYSMSHDLRAPLRALRSYADVMTQECAPALTPHGRHYLDRIGASAVRMDRLIQDILAFSCLPHGEIKPEPVDLDWLVSTIVENSRGSHVAESIAIDGTLPWVMGDPTALTQCVSNLIDNAVKFVPAGVAPHVRIRAEHVLTNEGEDRVRLHVRDNGIGVPKNAQASIFGMFHRLNKDYEGSGIGLAIVQRAVARMGGTVGLDSEAGNGSDFWLELKPAPFHAS